MGFNSGFKGLKFIGPADVSGGLMQINQHSRTFSFLRRKKWSRIVVSQAVQAHSN